MGSPTRLACLLASISLVLAGCATSLPQDGPTMAEIFAAHRSESQAGESAPPKDRRGPGLGDVAAYTRSATRELDVLFPKLRNPDLVMYTFPHATAEGAPVPGYTTSFPLYERDHFALPGEEGL